MYLLSMAVYNEYSSWSYYCTTKIFVERQLSNEQFLKDDEKVEK